MKVMAFNGSPRKHWNTAAMLEKALEGSASQGAETELVHLYELDFKGCISCFACKTINGQNYGSCALKDDLSPILKKIEETDAIILGSPMYFGSVSGEMRSFMERLQFPYLEYTEPPNSLFPRKINTGIIYTMNCPEKGLKDRGYDQYFVQNEGVLKMIFGRSESIYSCETLQFEDYAKVVSSRFDPEKRLERHRDVFPKDCQKAFDMGVRFAREV
ncbi:MAG: flavodoxin family protein [Bacillota bacterium]|nr:flavodoxin family protein [Bacillota bacterium]